MGKILKRQHPSPDSCVISHSEAQIRVRMHLAEEERVLTLGDKPQLAVQTRGSGEVNLMELTEPVDTSDTRHHAAHQSGQWNKKLLQHAS